MITTKRARIDEIRQLVSDSVLLVFETMLVSPATPISVEEMGLPEEEVVMGSVGFAGDVEGVVYLRLAPALAKKLAARMLGMHEHEVAEDMVNDVVGEIANMVVGSVKSQLCDSGSACVLSIPTVVRGHAVSVVSVSSAERRHLAFGCGGHGRFLVELLMKQSM